MSSLWDSAARAGDRPLGAFHTPAASIALSDLACASCLGGQRERLRGRSVLLAMREQLSTAIALLELDGIARRLVLCTPELSEQSLAQVAATAATDAELGDLDPHPISTAAGSPIERRGCGETEWILLTSGTTGQPKLVAHSLASLAGTLPRHTTGPAATGVAAAPASGTPAVWSTFYDIRRYGGLQIYLRAVLAGAPLVLSSANESPADFLARAAERGVTHISGTPSHWRRALMSGAAGLLEPAYVRLSGEVADQVLLERLREVYPKARIAHAFASTEAGVAFDVEDGRAGFPAEFIDLKVEDGTLRIRSRRIAASYLGGATSALADGDGYVDTGDLVELHGGRYYFRGRKGGVINVGGLKVYPEEVEGVINTDSRVRMSRVSAKHSPIMGALVVADVVLEDAAGGVLGPGETEKLRAELLEACRRALPAHKVPARLSFVRALELTAAGKLVRPGA
jgi:acyl-CoA synthetase (AMP-forming)/AMP-acid ligase II